MKTLTIPSRTPRRAWAWLPAAIWLLAALLLWAREPLSTNHLQWPRDEYRWSYRLIASPEEWAQLDTLQGEARQRYYDIFWKRRDPTPTTDRNEFKEQFEERVDFARTRFSVNAQPEPWDRRGEIFIRFGEPDDRIDSSFDANYEKWYYFTLNLKFMFSGGTEGLRLRPFIDFNGQRQSLPEFNDYRVRMEHKGVLYSPPLGEVPVDMALDWYPFRRADGNYDVYVACAMSMRAVAKRTRDRGGQLQYTTRVVAFDSVLANRWVDSVQVNELVPRIAKDARAQNAWGTVLPPGFYVVAAEMDDAQSGKRAVSAFDGWLVPHAATAELDLSPLVMAAEVRDASTDAGVFVRNGKEIVPQTGNVYTDRQDVAFYHEVYNLRSDATGHCRYRVEYALYDEGRRDRTTLMSREYTSAETNTFQVGSIPHDRLDAGTYIIEVETTDLVTDVTRIALARIHIE